MSVLLVTIRLGATASRSRRTGVGARAGDSVRAQRDRLVPHEDGHAWLKLLRPMTLTLRSRSPAWYQYKSPLALLDQLMVVQQGILSRCDLPIFHQKCHAALLRQKRSETRDWEEFRQADELLSAYRYTVGVT
ncbi:hypothetical protein EDB83DRAFT_2315395 [Lactarius deliciosus]|nr:hypothetical protein EDB83DRAFT_2315395 [Lactarius deliciosus]